MANVDLPLAWETTPIRELCTLYNGKAFKPSDWGEAGLPIVRIQNLNDLSKPYNHFSGDVADRYLIHDGDVLISWSGTPGTSFGAHLWSGGPAILNQHIFRVVFRRSDIDKRFFMHAVNWKLDELIDQAHGGVGLRHITKGKLEAVEVPLPSLDEQRHIVALIEDLFERIEDATRLRATAEEDAGRLLDATVAETMSALPPKRIPLMKVLGEKPRNGWSPKGNDDPTGVPVLRLGAVLGFRYDPTAVKFTKEPTREGAHYWLRSGDLLISRSNTPKLVGHAAIYNGTPTPCIYPDLLMRMRVDEKHANADFVVFWLRSPETRHYIGQRARGASSTMKKIAQGDVREIPFPQVPLSEQRRIVEYLAGVQTQVAELKRLQAGSAAELARLRGAVLAQAFRGEL